MRTTDMIKRIEEIKELESMIAELKAEMESYKDELKAELTERDVEELEAGQYIVRYTDVLSNRLDSSRMKKDLPELYKSYTKQVASKRFTIS